MFKEYSKQINKFKISKYFKGIFVIALVAIVGIYIYSISYASTPYASTQATSGSLTGPATIKTLSDGSKSIQFGSTVPSSNSCSSFFINSVFCQKITNATVVPNSAAMVSSFVSQYKSHYGSVAFNNASYGIPIYRVSSTQSLSPVEFNSAACPGRGAIPTLSVPIPSGATGASGTDSSAIFYQASTNSDWEYWEFKYLGNGVYGACAGGKISPVSTSNGVFPSSGSQLASSGISYLATLITETDVLSGAINHAIPFAMPQCDGYIPPARSNYDCSGGIIPYGQFFRFPSSVAMPSGLTPLAQMIFHAIQNYGMVLTDTAGSVGIGAESPQGWQLTNNTNSDPITTAMNGVPEYNLMNNFPWSQLQAVTEP